jgi:hypothetical protein
MSTLDHRLETVTGARLLVITDAGANLIEKPVYRPEDRDAKPSKSAHLQKRGRLGWRPLSF